LKIGLHLKKLLSKIKGYTFLKYSVYRIYDNAAAASPPGEWQYVVKHAYLPVLR